MKRKWFLALAVIGVTLAADSAAQHREWMDAAQEFKDDLGEAIEAKSAAKAVAPGQKLVQSGVREERYWRNAKVPAAVEIAQGNLAASREVLAAVKDGHFDAAAQAYTVLNETYRQCHDLHPEKQLNQGRHPPL